MSVNNPVIIGDDEEPYNAVRSNALDRTRRLGVPPVALIDLDVVNLLNIAPTRIDHLQSTSSHQHQVSLDACYHQGEILKTKTTVELRNNRGRPAEYLTITSIIKLPDGRIILEGLLSRRHEYMQGVFNQDLNECCLLIDICVGQANNMLDYGLRRVSLEQVLRTRHMIFTSQDFPKMSFHGKLNNTVPTKGYVRNYLNLTCRWVLITTYPNENAKRKGHGEVEIELRRIHAAEVLIDGTNVRKADITNTTRHQPRAHVPATYVSLFSGAGGDATGARLAGAIVVGGAERDPGSMETFKANHPDALAVLQDLVHPWRIDISELQGRLILHLSPPCQTWSRAHTTIGRNDDMNSAAILLIEQKIKDLKPTYVTLENAAGLGDPQHTAFFNTMLNMITGQGYNIRLQPACDFVDFGLTTFRNRLILFAAKNGYPLPKFPKTTHAKLPIAGDGRLPWNNVNDVIATVPVDDALHQMTFRFFPEPQAPEIRTVFQCIICNGPKENHPSGMRKLTHRECATMLGYPLDYKFIGSKTEIMRQIGNSICPSGWKHFIAAIIRSHRQFEDGLISEWGEAFPANNARQQPFTSMASFRSALPRLDNQPHAQASAPRSAGSSAQAIIDLTAEQSNGSSGLPFTNSVDITMNDVEEIIIDE